MCTAFAAAQSFGQGPPATHFFRGRIEDINGVPLGDAPLQLLGSNGCILQSTVTDPAGYFEFGVTADGPYELDVNLRNQTASVVFNDSAQGSMTLHVPIVATPVRPATPEDTAPEVSANELEAPPKARAKLNDAVRELTKPDLPQALDAVNQALEKDPDWGRALWVRAVIEMKLQNVEGAQADLNAALQADPGYAPAYITRGHLEMDQQRYDVAEQDLRHAMEIPPVVWQAYYEMANLDLRMGNYAEAKQMAMSALLAEPAGPDECHFIAAQAADRLQDFGAAALEYRAYLNGHPRSADAAAFARERLVELAPASPPPLK